MSDLKELLGRVLIVGEIKALTGLHIGGSSGALAIGNVDMPVIRNVCTGQPYIPGSSLKGKMRSLSEKFLGATQNQPINQGKADGTGKVRIHVAKSKEDYEKYWVNPIFGVPGDSGTWVTAPNRLVVRDIPLTGGSAGELAKIRTDMPYTEVKWEAAIDRVTSAATPRQIERVPAGAVFGPMEMVFSLYGIEDVALLGNLFTAMRLLEDDYLGGHGSRGSGQIAFCSLKVSLRCSKAYQTMDKEEFSGLDLKGLINHQDAILDWIKTSVLPTQEGG